jgi:hypothetical protein
MAYQDKVVDGIPLTRDNFTRPPLEMGIVPFWFWNGDLDYDEMEWQLQEYYDKGVRSLFIHGRMGLNVPYLSEGWFDRVKFVVEKAKEIGIDAWVYDEMDWPSGTAQRQVIEADPNLGQRYLELVALHIEGPIFTFLEAHDSRYVATGNSNPVAAFGVKRLEYENTIQDTIDLTRNLAWQKTIAWEAPAGRWMLMYFLEKEAPFYIDTLDPAATKKFIELTHEKYKATVGDEFGKTVPGFFTDEPAMYYFEVGLVNNVIPWSKQMFKIFRERRGYDLKPLLPALYKTFRSPEETARIRYDFWRTLTEQYADTYYKQIRDWCDDNGVIFTGHLLFEEHLRLAARCEGNIFKYLQHMHMIGVDHLYPKIGTAKEPSQHVALKLGSSAAHHFDSPRLLCESMGGTYWNCTLERMKWMNNWEYVLGVNLFNNHGYHYTIEGERKRDWPPSQFYHHTWWKYYDRFIEYNARLSHVLTGGTHVAKVLMLYPINSIWTNYTPQERNSVGDVIEADFNYLTDTLLRLHYDYDYVDEDVLAGATVEDGTIRIRDEVFEVFVLPPVTHIKEATYNQLKSFVEGGGTLICTTLVPTGLLEVQGNGRIGSVTDFFGLNPTDILAQFESDDAVPFELVRPMENVVFLQGDGVHNRRVRVETLLEEVGPQGRQLTDFLANDKSNGGALARVGAGGVEVAPATADDPEALIADFEEFEVEKRENIRKIFEEAITPDVRISDDDIFYLHRVKDGFDLFFLTNVTQTDRGRVTISFETIGRPELWNLNTGETTPINVFRVEDDRLVIELDFPASEGHVVAISGELPDRHVTDANIDVTAVESDVVIGYARDAESVEVALGGVDDRRLQAEGRAPRTDIELPERYDFSAEQPNVLVIEHWKMQVVEDAEDESRWSSSDFDDTSWLDVTNGAWEMQLPQERYDPTYPVTLWYRTTFDIETMPDSGLRLMIDGFAGEEYRLWLNGEEVKERGERSYLDAEIREVDVTRFLKQGSNSVVVRLVATRKTDGMLDLLKIIGDFSVDGSSESGYAITAKRNGIDVGDWTSKGYPFFSGTGVYRASFDVPTDHLDGGRLILEADCGEDVLEVSINGSEGRVAPWHPYRIDVTDLLQAGQNEIELRVTNTLLNILEGVSQASGLFAAPRLVHEHRYELK